MDLIESYIAAAIALEEGNRTGLDTNEAVSHNHQLADRLRHTAMTLEADHPERKDEFCQLLSHPNPAVRIWCAHHILEVMSYEKKQRNAALKEIRVRAKKDYGEALWLDNWYTDHPADKPFWKH